MKRVYSVDVIPIWQRPREVLKKLRNSLEFCEKLIGRSITITDREEKRTVRLYHDRDKPPPKNTPPPKRTPPRTAPPKKKDSSEKDVAFENVLFRLDCEVSSHVGDFAGLIGIKMRLFDAHCSVATIASETLSNTGYKNSVRRLQSGPK